MSAEPPTRRPVSVERDQVVTALIALACIGAIVLSATTLASTLQTEPDEAIDLDFDLLPVGESQAVTVKDEIESGSASRGTAPSTGPGSDEKQVQQPAGGADDGDARDSASQDESGGSQTTDSGAGQSPAQRDLLDRLLAILTRLLPILVGLAVVIGLAIRYRDQLIAIGRARFGSGHSDPAGRRPTHWTPHPRNDVERAWLSLVRRTGVDRPWTRTTGECAAAAIERGYDRESVARLRRLFEEVRYGDRRVTDRRVRRAHEHLDALGVEDGA